MAAVTFITPLDCLNEFGDTEMAQLSDKEGSVAISGDNFRVTITDGNRDNWPVSLTAQADAAEVRLQQAVDVANEMMTGAARTGCALPADVTPVTIPADCKHHVLRLARYYLYGDGRPEHIRQDYTDATDWLKQVATGRVTLDFGLTTGPQSGGTTITSIRFPLMADGQAGYGWWY